MFEVNRKKQMELYIDEFTNSVVKSIGLEKISDSSKFNIVMSITLTILGLLNKNDGPRLNRVLIDDLTYSSQELVKNLRFKLKEVILDDSELKYVYEQNPELGIENNLENLNVNGFLVFKSIYEFRVEPIVNQIRNESDSASISLGVFVYLSKLKQLKNDVNFSNLLENIQDIFIKIIKLR
jgi:hypothetical protein